MQNIDSYINKFNPLLSVIFFFIFFFVTIFSIYKIILLASPLNRNDVSTVLNNVQKSEKVKILNSMLYTTKKLDYKDINKNLMLFKSDSLVPTDSIIPNKLASDVKFKILDLKYSYITTQLVQELISQQKSLILRIWFWVWSFIAWFGIIFCNKLANHVSDILIKKVLKIKEG